MEEHSPYVDKHGLEWMNKQYAPFSKNSDVPSDIRGIGAHSFKRQGTSKGRSSDGRGQLQAEHSAGIRSFLVAAPGLSPQHSQAMFLTHKQAPLRPEHSAASALGRPPSGRLLSTWACPGATCAMIATPSSGDSATAPHLIPAPSSLPQLPGGSRPHAASQHARAAADVHEVAGMGEVLAACSSYIAEAPEHFRLTSHPSKHWPPQSTAAGLCHPPRPASGQPRPGSARFSQAAATFANGQQHTDQGQGQGHKGGQGANNEVGRGAGQGAVYETGSVAAPVRCATANPAEGNGLARLPSLRPLAALAAARGVQLLDLPSSSHHASHHQQHHSPQHPSSPDTPSKSSKEHTISWLSPSTPHAAGHHFSGTHAERSSPSGRHSIMNSAQTASSPVPSPPAKPEADRIHKPRPPVSRDPSASRLPEVGKAPATQSHTSHIPHVQHAQQTQHAQHAQPTPPQQPPTRGSARRFLGSAGTGRVNMAGTPKTPTTSIISSVAANRPVPTQTTVSTQAAAPTKPAASSQDVAPTKAATAVTQPGASHTASGSAPQAASSRDQSARARIPGGGKAPVKQASGLVPASDSTEADDRITSQQQDTGGKAALQSAAPTAADGSCSGMVQEQLVRPDDVVTGAARSVEGLGQADTHSTVQTSPAAEPASAGSTAVAAAAAADAGGVAILVPAKTAAGEQGSSPADVPHQAPAATGKSSAPAAAAESIPAVTSSTGAVSQQQQDPSNLTESSQPQSQQGKQPHVEAPLQPRPEPQLSSQLQPQPEQQQQQLQGMATPSVGTQGTAGCNSAPSALPKAASPALMRLMKQQKADAGDEGWGAPVNPAALRSPSSFTKQIGHAVPQGSSGSFTAASGVKPALSPDASPSILATAHIRKGLAEDAPAESDNLQSALAHQQQMQGRKKERRRSCLSAATSAAGIAGEDGLGPSHTLSDAGTSLFPHTSHQGLPGGDGSGAAADAAAAAEWEAATGIQRYGSASNIFGGKPSLSPEGSAAMLANAHIRQSILDSQPGEADNLQAALMHQQHMQGRKKERRRSCLSAATSAAGIAGEENSHAAAAGHSSADVAGHDLMSYFAKAAHTGSETALHGPEHMQPGRQCGTGEDEFGPAPGMQRFGSASNIFGGKPSLSPESSATVLASAHIRKSILEGQPAEEDNLQAALMHQQQMQGRKKERRRSCLSATTSAAGIAGEGDGTAGVSPAYLPGRPAAHSILDMHGRISMKQAVASTEADGLQRHGSSSNMFASKPSLSPETSAAVLAAAHIRHSILDGQPGESDNLQAALMHQQHMQGRKKERRRSCLSAATSAAGIAGEETFAAGGRAAAEHPGGVQSDSGLHEWPQVNPSELLSTDDPEGQEASTGSRPLQPARQESYSRMLLRATSRKADSTAGKPELGDDVTPAMLAAAHIKKGIIGSGPLDLLAPTHAGHLQAALAQQQQLQGRKKERRKSCLSAPTSGAGIASQPGYGEDSLLDGFTAEHGNGIGVLIDSQPVTESVMLQQEGFHQGRANGVAHGLIEATGQIPMQVPASSRQEDMVGSQQLQAVVADSADVTKAAAHLSHSPQQAGVADTPLSPVESKPRMTSTDVVNSASCEPTATAAATRPANSASRATSQTLSGFEDELGRNQGTERASKLVQVEAQHRPKENEMVQNLQVISSDGSTASQALTGFEDLLQD